MDFPTITKSLMSGSSKPAAQRLTNNHKFKGIHGDPTRLDRLNQLTIPHYDKMQESIVTALEEHKFPPTKEIILLEAGCGTGYTTKKILKTMPTAKLICIDYDPRMIEHTKKVVQDDREQILWLEQDLLDTLKALPDKSIDAFVSAHALHNMPKEEREEIFEQISRVLKSGGLFINSDIYAHDNPETYKQIFDARMQTVRKNLASDPLWRNAWIKHYYEDRKIKFLESEQHSLFKRFGFDKARITFRESLEATFVAAKRS